MVFALPFWDGLPARVSARLAGAAVVVSVAALWLAVAAVRPEGWWRGEVAYGLACGVVGTAHALAGRRRTVEPVKSAAVYTAGRVLIFLVLAGLGWLAGLRGFLLVIAALLLSMPMSYFFLARQRDAPSPPTWSARSPTAGPGTRTCAPSCAATTRPSG